MKGEIKAPTLTPIQKAFVKFARRDSADASLAVMVHAIMCGNIGFIDRLLIALKAKGDLRKGALAICRPVPQPARTEQE